MSLKTDKLQLDIVINSDESRKKIQDLELECNDFARQMRALIAENGKAAKDSVEYLKLLDKFNINKDKIKDLRNEIGITGSTIKELLQRQGELNASMKGMDPNLPKFKELKAELVQVRNRLKELRGTAIETEGTFSKFKKSFMEGIGIGSGIAAVTAAFHTIVGAFKEAINRSVEYQERLEKLKFALNDDSYALNNMVKFAKEMSATSLFTRGQIMDAQTMAISLGRNEEQAKKMVIAAMAISRIIPGTDLNKAMLMLNGTLGGVTKGLEKMIPDIKGMTAEQYLHGKAIDLIVEKYGKFATEGLETTQGKITMFGKAWESLTLSLLGSGDGPISKLINLFTDLGTSFLKGLQAINEGALKIDWAGLGRRINLFLNPITAIVGIYKTIFGKGGELVKVNQEYLDQQEYGMSRLDYYAKDKLERMSKNWQEHGKNVKDELDKMLTNITNAEAKGKKLSEDQLAYKKAIEDKLHVLNSPDAKAKEAAELKVLRDKSLEELKSSLADELDQVERMLINKVIKEKQADEKKQKLQDKIDADYKKAIDDNFEYFLSDRDKELYQNHIYYEKLYKENANNEKRLRELHEMEAVKVDGINKKHDEKDIEDLKKLNKDKMDEQIKEMEHSRDLSDRDDSKNYAKGIINLKEYEDRKLETELSYIASVIAIKKQHNQDTSKEEKQFNELMANQRNVQDAKELKRLQDDYNKKKKIWEKTGKGLPELQQSEEKLNVKKKDMGEDQIHLLEAIAEAEEKKKKAEIASATQSGISAVEGAKSVTEAGKKILDSIRQQIKAKLALMLSDVMENALESVPFPLDIIAATAAAGSLSFLFDQIVPNFAAGNVDVIGASDGRRYNAARGGMITQPTIINRPTLIRSANGRDVLTAEAGLPEMIIDGPRTRNIMMNYPEIYDAIRSVSQYGNGNVGASSGGGMFTDPEMLAAIKMLNQHLASTNFLVFDRQYKRFQKKVNDVESNFGTKVN